MEEKIRIGWENKNYTACWGTVKFKSDANTVAKEIESIGGSVTAQQVVDYAKNNADSELHKCFEWDDTRAADLYRNTQARSIICSLKITYVSARTNEQVKTPVRYFSMSKPKCGVYEKTEVIVKNVDKYQELLATAKAQLIAFKNRYSTLSELEEVFEAIDRL